MANLVEWLLSMAENEEIEAVVIGEMGWGDYNSETVPDYASHPRAKVLSWEEAKPLLDYEFNRGFGAPGCEAVWAYTKSWVIAIAQYDGATWPYRIPRNPTEGIMPQMQGDG